MRGLVRRIAGIATLEIKGVVPLSDLRLRDAQAPRHVPVGSEDDGLVDTRIAGDLVGAAGIDHLLVAEGAAALLGVGQRAGQQQRNGGNWRAALHLTTSLPSVVVMSRSSTRCQIRRWLTLSSVKTSSRPSRGSRLQFTAR